MGVVKWDIKSTTDKQSNKTSQGENMNGVKIINGTNGYGKGCWTLRIQL